ncbi:MAG TPA: hypothetical protein VGV38_23225, partial [Pyrinomonadaceae bacterium]|nr:hypothetical protein [Pyrinomonadaceae bacterium]
MSRRMAQLTTLSALALVFTLAALISPTPAGAQATTNTTNVSVPTNIVVFVACANGGAGEFVLLSGDLHILMHFTSNKNHVTIKSHFQPQGISGTGLTTGDTYRATGVTQETTTFQNDGGPFVDTFVNNFRVIGQG